MSAGLIGVVGGLGGKLIAAVLAPRLPTVTTKTP